MYYSFLIKKSIFDVSKLPSVISQPTITVFGNFM